MKHKVYVCRCGDYRRAEESVAALLEQMGGMGRFARPGEALLLKANLLRAARPEQAVCTHPAVAAAVAKLTAAQGAKVTIADSPGGPYSAAALRHVYARSGMEQAAAQSGAALNYDVSTTPLSHPEGRVLQRMEVITPAARADGILNVCKMKTHLFMSMTGAVKNSFGLIAGVSKVGFHATHPDKVQFAHMLLDLNLRLPPRLNLMDAVLAMEGEGPGASGTPRQVGLLLASESALALDVAAGAIMGLPRALNPVLLAAGERGLTPTHVEEVELVGADWEDLRIPDYRFPAHVRSNIMEFLGPLTGPAARLCKSALSSTPRIKPEVCVGCGICRDACPAKAISMTGPGGTALVNPRACIHCYCCHELCPQKAVGLRRGLLSRL